ncbi:MAG: DNA repair protein RecO [Thermodesulfovibrionia bacterium]|nr:DNA repair protein RecO [Thermodesulfovibrionia bacterium]
MLTTTEGIVLRTQKYAEADLIVTYLTLNKGIIKAFAKSPRKTKSRFGSSLEPLTYSKITLMGKEQSMPKIIQSDILKPFYRLRENFQDYIHISKLIEILIALTLEGTAYKKLFLFLLNVMNLSEMLNPPFPPFNKGGEAIFSEQKKAFYITSQIHLLKILGYEPRLKGCGKCGTKCFYFYPHLGTALCRKCAVTQSKKNASPIKITSKLIKFYSHCTGWSLHASTRLRPPREIISALSTLLDEHINHLLNKRLMSSEFLAKVIINR